MGSIQRPCEQHVQLGDQNSAGGTFMHATPGDPTVDSRILAIIRRSMTQLWPDDISSASVADADSDTS